MPDTPNGLTYPDSAAHTRLWEHFQTLALDVDAWLDYLLDEKTELCAYGSGFSTAGSGPAARVNRRGKLVILTAKVARTSGTGTSAFTVPVGFRPSANFAPAHPVAVNTWNAGTADGPRIFGNVDVTTGLVSLTAPSGGPSWTSGTFINVVGSWFTDDAMPA